MSSGRVQETPHAVQSGEVLTEPRARAAIVIPAYNEEEGVGPTVAGVREAIASSPFDFEIIVVDDGSTDDTARRAEQEGARVIRQRSNGGYGSALKAGILRSESEFVVITDADGTYPFAAIPRLMEIATDADMVVGSRSANDVSSPLIRRPAKWVLRRLASYLAGREIPDLNSGLRVMRRSVLEKFMHVLPSGFSFTMTITLSMLCNDYRVIYEPIVCQKRIGASKIRAVDAVSFLILVLRTVVLFNPLKVFLPFGALLFVTGLGKLIYDLFLLNISETAVMALLGACLVWAVGLLADLIVRLELGRSNG